MTMIVIQLIQLRLHIVLFLIAFVANVNIIIDFAVVTGRAVVMCQIVSLTIRMVGILIIRLMAGERVLRLAIRMQWIGIEWITQMIAAG